jgi:hypothetical protein
MAKRNCTHRAKWRLLRGQPAQQLSAHYQLDCDYGTAIIKIYKEGDPIFLCESHATAVGQLDDNYVAGVRPIKAPSIESNIAPKTDDRIPSLESAAIKPSAPAPSETLGSLASIRVGRETTDPFFRGHVRDPTYGNSAKALVDETIWNMATGDYEAYRAALRQGKTAAEAAQAAGGQLAIVHRKISEYTLEIEAVLSESKKTIKLSDVIDKPLEDATLEIITTSVISEAEKDAAIDHLGALQEQIKRGLSREITPLQAHRLARSIGDRADWGAESSLSEELKPAYRAVYRRLRNAIHAAVPHAHDLDERLANLCAAKSDLENVPPPKA